MIIDKGHFEIIVKQNKNKYEVFIRNKFSNCLELYDDNLNKKQMENTLKEI